jgi:hypothetical protein
MKRIASALLVLALLGFTGAVQAQKIAPEPAATLLLPYFEVDLVSATGVNTLFSINNAYSGAILAHVVVWSDLSVPVLDFDVYLTGYDVQTVSLRDLLVNGQLPQTSYAGGSCAGLLPYPPLSATFINHLQTSLTGRPSPVLGNLCAGLNHGNLIARGYVTVDTVNDCSLLFPGDPGYFGGIVTDDNVLWGETFVVDPGQRTAAGNPLVHIPALSTPAVPGDYTFYGRYVSWLGFDNRRPLATSFAARYLADVSLPPTDLIVWRDSKVITRPFPCTQRPPWFPLGEEGVAIFDEQENLDLLHPGWYPFPAEAQRVQIGGPNLPVPFSFGWINPNLNVFVPSAGAVPPFDPFAAQGWVSIVIDPFGWYDFHMGYDAIQLDTAGNPLHSVPPP